MVSMGCCLARFHSECLQPIGGPDGCKCPTCRTTPQQRAIAVGAIENGTADALQRPPMLSMELNLSDASLNTGGLPDDLSGALLGGASDRDAASEDAGDAAEVETILLDGEDWTMELDTGAPTGFYAVPRDCIPVGSTPGEAATATPEEATTATPGAQAAAATPGEATTATPGGTMATAAATPGEAATATVAAAPAEASLAICAIAFLSFFVTHIFCHTHFL